MGSFRDSCRVSFRVSFTVSLGFQFGLTATSKPATMLLRRPQPAELSGRSSNVRPSCPAAETHRPRRHHLCEDNVPAGVWCWDGWSWLGPKPPHGKLAWPCLRLEKETDSESFCMSEWKRLSKAASIGNLKPVSTNHLRFSSWLQQVQKTCS